MTTVDEITEQDRTEMRERTAKRENENNAFLVERIKASVEPYQGMTHGHYRSDDYLSSTVVDVEFPNYIQACAWTHDTGMLADVTVANPKVSLSSACTLTFSLMSFYARTLRTLTQAELG
jgi:hypothetical protein